MLNVLLVAGVGSTILLAVFEVISQIIPIAVVSKTYSTFGAAFNKRLGPIRFLLMLIIPNVWIFFIRRPLHKELKRDPRESGVASTLTWIPVLSVVCGVTALSFLRVASKADDPSSAMGYLILAFVLGNGITVLQAWVYTVAFKHYGVSAGLRWITVLTALVHRGVCFIFIMICLSKVEDALMGGAEVDHTSMSQAGLMNNKSWMKKSMGLVYKNKEDTLVKQATGGFTTTVEGVGNNVLDVAMASVPTAYAETVSPYKGSDLQSVLNSDSSTQE